MNSGDEVEATLSRGEGFRHNPHTIRGVMQTPERLSFHSAVTGETTELDLATLEHMGYKVRVVHTAHAVVSGRPRRRRALTWTGRPKGA